MGKNVLKSIMIFAAALVMVLCVPVISHAAPQTMPDGGVFDAEFYAAKYPDVVVALGTDPATLYAHYVLFGKSEGRLPYEGTAAAPVSVSALSPIDIYNVLAASDGYVWMYYDSSSYFTAYSFDAKGGFVEITHSGILGDMATVGAFSVATGNYLPAKVDYKVGAIDKNAAYLYMVNRVITDGSSTFRDNKTTAYKIVGFDGTNLIVEVKTGYGIENRVLTKMLFS